MRKRILWLGLSFLRVALVAALVLIGRPAPVVADEVVEISVWWHTGKPAELAFVTALVEEFNAMQDEIRAELVVVPEAGYTEAVKLAALAGELPDVLHIDGPTMARFVWDGYLLPLCELICEKIIADMLPTIIAQGTYPGDGKIYALGFLESGLALWGNRSYLERAGVRIPTGVEDAWTLEEFHDALERLAALPEVEWPLDLKLNYGAGEWFTYAFSPILQSFGGDLIDRQTWKATGTLDSPESIAAMTLLQDWVQRGWVVPAAFGDDAFYGAKVAALAYVGHWMWPPHREGLGDDLILLPVPIFGDRAVTGMGSWAWTIPSTTEHPEAAARFLEHLLSIDVVLGFSDAGGAVPSRKAAIALSELYAPGGPLHLFVEQLHTIAVPRPAHPAYPTITTAFAEAVRDIIAGADVAEELAAAAARIDEYIRDHAGFPPFGE